MFGCGRYGYHTVEYRIGADYGEHMFLDITTQIGCRVNCQKYCPQELILKTHPDKLPLSLESFKWFIRDVPKEVMIQFAGHSEPFQNSKCIDMVFHAYDKGHRKAIQSTLVGLSVPDAKRLVTIPIERLLLHLPDACGNAKIPVTPEYLEVLGVILGGVKNIGFMNMGGLFTSAGVENMHRYPLKKMGHIWCEYLETPNYSLTPDGYVYFCCWTRGISGEVGSLRNTSYPVLMTNFPEYSKRMRKELCCYCPHAMYNWVHKLIKIKTCLFGDKRIFGELPRQAGEP